LLHKSETAKIAEKIYRGFAARFPVCCESDEFYFFPQCLAEEKSWSQWDDFSESSVAGFLTDLFTWDRQLVELDTGTAKSGEQTEIDLLTGLCRTVREQFEDVSFHQRQPTFYLTVACVGLAHALEQGGSRAFSQRAASLASLTETGLENMTVVPAVFHDRALEMAARTVTWLESLVDKGFEAVPALSAVENFVSGLRRVKAQGDFKLRKDIFEKVVSAHLGCGVSSSEVLGELEDEFALMNRELKKISESISPGLDWRAVYKSMGKRSVGSRTLKETFSRQIDDLLVHCIDSDLVTSELAEKCPVRVNTVPTALTAVRSADSYSARPGYPPSGGTFYIFEEGNSERLSEGIHPETRMTAAHEIWPGHHLLDACRWSLENAVRRPLESPLFYEGWACFAEQLTALTGYFTGPGDMLILAKRRMSHSIRGIVDISLHTGRMDLDEAADTLEAAGFARTLARQIVLRYTLHPGYQACYTLGLRRFQSLFDRFGRDDPADFVKIVMGQGEIPFGALERVFSDMELQA